MEVTRIGTSLHEAIRGISSCPVWKSFRRSHEPKRVVQKTILPRSLVRHDALECVASRQRLSCALFYLFHTDSQDRIERFFLRSSFAGPFIARTRDLDEEFLLRSVAALAPQEISLSSCGDGIALTKSSKGGVKACSRAKRKSKETKSIWLDHLLRHPLCPSPFFSSGFLGRCRAHRFIPLAIPSVFVASARGRPGEKGNSIFHG